MEKMDRKRFVKAAGAGSVAAAVGVPIATTLPAEHHRTLSFRARAGVPGKPLPGYATQIVEGTVDVSSNSGVVTTRVVAGHPADTGIVGLPGLSRIIRITEVSVAGDRFALAGVIEDRSQLARGEPAYVEITVDRAAKTVKAPFLGRQTIHALDA